MMTEQLYGVRVVVTAAEEGEVWHDDVVKLVAVHETEGKLGTIYCDLFVRCPVFGRNPRSRMPLSFTPLLRLKRCHAACDQWHSSRAFAPLTGWRCKSGPHTAGPP
jgi:hypothetical protein